MKGFSLLELLVVLTIMVLALGVALPAVVNKPLGAEATAVQTFLSAIKRARMRAASRQRESWVLVDIGRRRVSVASDAGVHLTTSLPASLDYELVTAKQEVIGLGHGRIRFYPDGSSTGGRIEIHAGLARRYLDVDWLTGRATLRSRS